MTNTVRTILAALIAAGATAAVAQPAAPDVAVAQTAPELGKAALDALVAAPQTVLFLDVRRPEEISVTGGFPAYLNIQLADLGDALGFIPRDRRIVAVSNHAGRARKAAALLIARGFPVIGVAGAETYAAQGGRLVGRKAAAGAAGAPVAPGAQGAPAPAAAR